MTTIHQMAERWRNVNLTNVAGDILANNTDKVAELQRQQLMKGLDSDGKELRPRHSENPYFKTRDAAARYAAWKKRLHPETPEDVPNLNITGYYHENISVTVAGGKIVFNNTASFAPSVSATFKEKQLGLSSDYKIIAWNNIIRAPLVQQLGVLTGCKIS